MVIQRSGRPDWSDRTFWKGMSLSSAPPRSTAFSSIRTLLQWIGRPRKHAVSRGNIRRNQDLYAGLTFIAFGLAAVFFARPLRFGTAAQMGPGYFPSVLGGILALLGLVILIRPLWSIGTRVSPLALRPLLFVTAAVLVFGVLLRPLGLVVATLALVVVARLADREFRVAESALAALVLAAGATALFVYGLRLPFNVWPR